MGHPTVTRFVILTDSRQGSSRRCTAWGCAWTLTRPTPVWPSSATRTRRCAGDGHRGAVDLTSIASTVPSGSVAGRANSHAPPSRAHRRIRLQAACRVAWIHLAQFANRDLPSAPGVRRIGWHSPELNNPIGVRGLVSDAALQDRGTNRRSFVHVVLYQSWLARRPAIRCHRSRCRRAVRLGSRLVLALVTIP